MADVLPDHSWRPGETVGQRLDRFNRARILAPVEADRDRYRAALERIGAMAGARATGVDARAMAALARAALASDEQDQP